MSTKIDSFKKCPQKINNFQNFSKIENLSETTKKIDNVFQLENFLIN